LSAHDAFETNDDFGLRRSSFGPGIEACFARVLGYPRRPAWTVTTVGGRRVAREVLEGGHGPEAAPRRRTGCGKGSEREVSEVKMKKGEPVDRALRRLKKKVDREGTLKEVRNHRHFEKPSEKRRRRMKVAKFNAMLAARYADV
jgi:small subunit ribosomal protein S21